MDYIIMLSAHYSAHYSFLQKRGAAYYHVGLDIKLPLIRTAMFRTCGQPQPTAVFRDPEPFWKSYLRQWREFYFFNLPIRVWMLASHHTLLEHHRRLLLADENSPLVNYSLDELYSKRKIFTVGKRIVGRRSK